MKVADKERFGANAEYIAYLGIKDFCPVWVLKGGVDFHQLQQTLSVYPFYRKQTINYTSYNALAVRNIINGKNMYSFSVDACYTSGGGTIKKDGEYATAGENQTRPKYSDEYLNNEYEYLTTGQLKGDIGIKYSRIFAKYGINGYVAANYSTTKAFNIKYLNSDNSNSITIAIGCTF